MTEERMIKKWKEYREHINSLGKMALDQYVIHEKNRRQHWESSMQRIFGKRAASPLSPEFMFMSAPPPKLEKPSFVGFMDWMTNSVKEVKENTPNE
jgi:hypothetical protein